MFIGRMRRYTPEEVATEIDRVRELLVVDLIEPSTFGWLPHANFSSSKDDTLRLFCNYVRSNMGDKRGGVHYS